MQKLLLFGLLIFISCKSSDLKEEEGSAERPNIILINIDDMGWKDVGYMGSSFYQTPNIDRLSTKGMVFTNAYACASNCAPSRAALMSGKWSSRTGIYTVNSSERGKSENRKLIPTKNIKTLSREHQTLANTLQNVGYKTCHAGKWHLSNNPLDYGFDQNIGGTHAGHPKSYYPPYKNVPLEADNNEYLTDLIMEKAMDFVDSISVPFFLNYTPYAVHSPIHPVDSIRYKYENKIPKDKQSNVNYATMVENVDRNIGLLIDHLENKDLVKNTIIIFTTDNGGVYGNTFMDPLRAGKGSYYEGGIRVPFFIVWKDKVKAGSTSDHPISQLDIYPTISKFLGISSSTAELDGEDLSPLLLGDKVIEESPLYWHFPIYLENNSKIQHGHIRDPLFRTRPGSVIRYGDWKLHHYFENNEYELYNLKEDLGERTNLVDENAEKFKELRVKLEDWRKKVNAPVPMELNPAYLSPAE